MRGLSGYHIMIVSKYFDNIKDFVNLKLVCKKFGGNMEKFHFNPTSLNSKTLGYFPNIETLHLWDEEDENFGNGFMIKRRENEDSENEVVLKKEFFRIIVWFNVDFETVDRNNSRNIEFKNVTYTQNDRKKFGNNIPPIVRSIGEKCFRWCGSLSSVNIPSSVRSIGDWCFNECISLTSVTISSSVTLISEKCFSECISLISI
ncbi:leucine rich repeat containing protein BspA family protein, partial [Entamoeba invadens IP1]